MYVRVKMYIFLFMCGPFEKTVNPFFLRLCGIVTTDIVLLLRAEIKLIIYMYRLDNYKNGSIWFLSMVHQVPSSGGPSSSTMQ